MDEVFRWAEELWLHHGIYSQAITKAVRYFMTDIEVYGDDITHQTRKSYKSALEDKYDILTEMSAVGDEFIAYGNSFTSLYVPFLRTVFCPRCGFSAPMKELKDQITWRNLQFLLNCPSKGCGFKGEPKITDTKVADDDMRPTVVHWPPQMIKIQHRAITGESTYLLDIQKHTQLVDAIKDGDWKYLQETPMEIIEAVREEQPLEFEPGQLFHMKAPIPAYTAVELQGWGLPKFMAEFEHVVMLSLLDKYNEVILSDYLVPFRVISPARTGAGPQQGSGDFMLNVGMHDFVSKIKSMVDGHRRNPADWSFSPVALEYQIMGGEAENLTPMAMMEHMEMRLLNSMGIPQEMYTGSINNAAGPIIGFRMFERTWQHFASELDKWLNWFMARNGELFQWDKAYARLVPVSLYEDPDVRTLKFQLAEARQCSKTTAFRTIGLDVAYESQRILDEEDEEAELQEERARRQEERQIASEAVRVPAPGEEILMAEQQAAEQQAGGMAPGGMPPQGAAPQIPPSGSAGSIDELHAQAEQLAAEIIQMPGGTRRSTLLDINKHNKELSALVKQYISEMENKAGQQGIEMARQGQM